MPGDKEQGLFTAPRPLKRSPPRGMAMMVTVFLLLILMPIVLVFAKWVSTHRRGTTQSRVQTKEYYAANGAFDATRYLIENGGAGGSLWLESTTFNTTLHVDTGTVVAVTVSHVGTP